MMTIKQAAAATLAAVTSVGVFAVAAPFALADMNSSTIRISTSNSGTIANTTSSSASTGGNTAGGSRGGDGGNGGQVTSAGDNNNGGASSGNGGAGGAGAAGGLVVTGDANSDAGVLNALNSTDVEITADGDMNSSRLVVDTDNDGSSVIANTTTARARTGGNTASGSTAGDAGNGGAITGGTGDGNNGGASSGNGGAGGAGGVGGEVETGVATSNSGVVNVLNSTIVRTVR